MLKNIVIFALILAFVVVSLGAYTRLKDAGLGCPDWPGCYGHIDVPMTEAEIVQANAAYPERPVEQHKAWAEMVHRYFASSLGLAIVIIAFLSFKQRRQIPETPLLLPLFLVALVIFQGLLGMWTVTLKLYPPIVMGHLLGGFATLCALWLLLLKLRALPKPDQAATPSTPPHHNQPPSTIQKVITFSYAALLLLVLQIALGGWTSSNYAAIACTELPICQSHWHSMDKLMNGFVLFTETTQYEYGAHLTAEAKQAIHMTHRLGAIVASFALIITALLSLKRTQSPTIRKLAIGLLIVLAVQFSLGLSNIILMLPLSVAVAHNVVALLLLLTLITLIVSLQRERGSE